MNANTFTSTLLTKLIAMLDEYDPMGEAFADIINYTCQYISLSLFDSENNTAHEQNQQKLIEFIEIIKHIMSEAALDDSEIEDYLKVLIDEVYFYVDSRI